MHRHDGRNLILNEIHKDRNSGLLTNAWDMLARWGAFQIFENLVTSHTTVSQE